MKFKILLTFGVISSLWLCNGKNKLLAQNLFLRDCFVGGITTGGSNSVGAVESSVCEIKWEEDYIPRGAYALTYRYGRPNDHTTYINDTPVMWDMQNQFGEELNEENQSTRYFAVHAEDITNSIEISADSLTIDLPPQEFNTAIPNEGYWGVHIIILYESPEITEPVCLEVYTANQNQESGQNYTFDKPNFRDETPLLFSIYSDRLSDSESDKSRIIVNDQVLGDIWTRDLIYMAAHGVQGTFFYENSEAVGLNGDTANTQVYKHDGIAEINSYLSEGLEQSIELFRVSNIPQYGFNPHPAFLLTYTPECDVATEEMLRQYTFCRGDSIQLQAITGYENYSWSSAEFLNDSALANPWCSADSSRWYTVRMWNEDESLCSQTIPVYIEVRQTPRANNVFTRSSSCPQATGEIRFEEMSGTPPFQYTVNGMSQDTPAFTPLNPGTYAISVEDEFGCTWDSTATVIYNPSHEAAFTANPDSGFTPLSVFFDNGSSINSTGFRWLINGEIISNSENIAHVFEEPGVYEVMLIATRMEESCTDTATATILVNQGLEMIIPNIITPNGDGQNDRLVAQIFGAASLRWTIFDRWGKELFSGNTSTIEENLVLWSPSRDIEDGQYFLVVAGFGAHGMRQEVKATVTVVR